MVLRSGNGVCQFVLGFVLAGTFEDIACLVSTEETPNASLDNRLCGARGEKAYMEGGDEDEVEVLSRVRVTVPQTATDSYKQLL